MKQWTKYCTGLVTLAGLTPGLWAQVPVAVPVAPDAAVVAPAAAAKPGTLWSFLGLTKEQKEAFKRKCCETKFGQLLNNMLKPVSIMSGGILGNFCPTTPTLADQAKPGAEGEAAKIQAEEADAPKRRAAVRYLGTVDCHYWGPEVEPALIGALRTDKNECVRWEAAMALGRGCCCTKKTIQALAITVSASTKDGNPSEKSERVKAAASVALQHCLICYHETVAAPTPEETPPPRPLEKVPTPVEPPPATLPEKTAAANGSGVQLTSYTRQLDSMSLEQVVENAQHALDQHGHAIMATGSPHSSSGHSLMEVYTNAVGISNVSTKTPPAPEKVVGTAEMSQVRPHVTPIAVQVPTPVEPVVTPTPAPMSSRTATVIATSSTLPASVPPAAPARTTPAVKSSSPANSGATPSQVSEHTRQLLSVLQNSINPEQRESAANQLAGVDPRKEPQVVQALATAAREDAAAIVRVACVRALGQMNAGTPAVLTVLQGLKTDRDPRVRHAVDKTLVKLGAGQRPMDVQVQPAAYSVPGKTN